jgi:hypothetical protein
MTRWAVTVNVGGAFASKAVTGRRNPVAAWGPHLQAATPALGPEHVTAS